ncbi:MAG TPA: histidine phosphatase family protein [Rhizomicrobium sp.]|nr:histidine phosphatase family protein [Rhizomicrobium sp.]
MSFRLALIRHGPTAWNAQNRFQGSIDIPLSEEGIARMAALAPPNGFEKADAYSSPLSRARQTAELLGYPDPVIDARLTEQNWGEWEGLTRLDVIARHGPEIFEHAGSGLVFRPPSGESAGEVRARLSSFLHDIAVNRTRDAVAIVHRGVIRSAYALARGWDLLGAMPDDLDLSAALILNVDKAGRPSIVALNVPLKTKASGAHG